MKIDKNSTPLPATPGRETASPAAAKSGPAPAVQQTADTSVSLGAAAVQLRSMESSMAGAPVINTAKVEEIKQAIAEGRFKVNPEAVASRLIETVHGLIGNKT